jgi:phage FluMu protein Com
MKIIKDSRKVACEFTKRITCHACNSIYEIDADDISCLTDFRDGDYFSVICPVCKSLDTFTDIPTEVRIYVFTRKP